MKKLALVLLLVLSASLPIAGATSAQAGPALNPANGHYYEVVAGSQTWYQARDAAAASTYQGCPGHLVTVTSAEENSFVLSTFSTATLNRKWMGGFQEAGVTPPTAGWKWVTGEPFNYTYWHPNEPNDWYGYAAEQALQYYLYDNNSTPSYDPVLGWNDERINVYVPGYMSGYIVEYECNGSTISGRVTDAALAPIPGVTVTADPGQGGTPLTAQTDADGKYTITALAGGSYTLSASKQDYIFFRTPNKPVDVPPDAKGKDFIGMPACKVPPGSTAKVEAINDYAPCGPAGPRSATWGAFGHKPFLESNVGEKLELLCLAGSQVNSFALFYTPPGGQRVRVGTCPFEGGCNQGYFWHSGNTNGDDKPDCILSTFWYSRDLGNFNDEAGAAVAQDRTLSKNPWTRAIDWSENTLDRAETHFTTWNQYLRKLDYKYTYYGVSADVSTRIVFPPLDGNVFCGPSAPFAPEGPLQTWTVVDPPVGPETEAFFDEVMETLQEFSPSGIAPMKLYSPSRCDFDGNGACDALDFEHLAASLGACRGDAGYDPVVDADGDGCITGSDQQPLFPVIPVRITIKPGSQPSPISPRAKGVIPVSILTSSIFDATSVDSLSIRFGRTNASEVHKEGHIEDVNSDGKPDMMLHFAIEQTGIAAGDTKICLSGVTKDGLKIEGCDSIQTVPN